MADDAKPISTPKKSALQLRKEADDAALAAHEIKASSLGENRKNYFRVNGDETAPAKNDAETLAVVNLLQSRVDCIREPAKRKEFFWAHPELEIRYSAINFK